MDEVEKIIAKYDNKVSEVLENLLKQSSDNFAKHFQDEDQHFVPVDPEVFKLMTALYMSQMPTKQEWIGSLIESCRKKYGNNFVLRSGTTERSGRRWKRLRSIWG
jgi:hypothetical protein